MSVQLSNLTVEEKVGQLFFIGIGGPTVDEEARDLLKEIAPGGICLFARNIREATQTRDLNDALRSMLPVEPLLSIDQEGGLVDRLRRIVTPMPAAGRLRNAEDAARLARIIGETLRILGFNMDFAPVVDVIDEDRARHTNGLFSRELGRGKTDVAERAGSFMDSLRASGILGCLKHFPGLGASRVDSHEELPLVDIGEPEFEQIDLFPYRELLGRTDCVMVAHAAYPGLSLQETDQSGKLLPSSLSHNFVSTLLRDRLGFGGLVVTDDLEMGAILKNYGIGEACKMAVNAGADMLAVCSDAGAIREGSSALLGAVKSGEIAGERLDASVERILLLKQKVAPPSDLNSVRLAEISDLIATFNDELSG